MAPEAERAFAPLIAGERAQLLTLAHEALAAHLAGLAAPKLATPSPVLREPCGVFISVYAAAHLRGCIGTLSRDDPLDENVARFAVAAASEDPRFPPLTEDELPTVSIEISRLSPLTPLQPETLVVGVDGVCLTHGALHAVFLPQVAPRYGWDAQQLLAELCRKAGLPDNAWHAPACRLERFRAEVFGDVSPRAD